MFRPAAQKATIKQTVDTDFARRKREDKRVEIRKLTREASVQKRRQTRQGASVPGGILNNNVNNSLDDTSRFVDGGAEGATGAPGSTLTPEEIAAQQREMQMRLEQLPELVRQLAHSDTDKQIEAATTIRKLLSTERNPPIKQVVSLNAVPTLVALLSRHDSPSLQFEAAWALTNVASGNTEETMTVVQNHAVPYFIQLLSSSHDNVREQAVWALGNIAGDGANCRDYLLACQIMAPLLELCHPATNSLAMLRTAIWTLSNLSRGKPAPRFELVQPCLPVLAIVLAQCNDTDTLIDACWAISYLSDDSGDNNHKIQQVLHHGIGPHLIRLLMHTNQNVKTPALRAVGNIVTGDDLQTQVMINGGVLMSLVTLLKHRRRPIRKEACWTVSNITAGNALQVTAVIDAGIIPLLVELLHTDHFDVQKEAAWAISNATTNCTHQQIDELGRCGVIQAIARLLRHTDTNILLVCLECIEHMLRSGFQRFGVDNVHSRALEECQGVAMIDQLQHHVHEEVYKKSFHIIRSYFDGSGEEEAGVIEPLASADGTQYQFNPDQQGGAGGAGAGAGGAGGAAPERFGF